MKMNVPEIHKEFTAEMAAQGTPLNREQRRRLKKSLPHKVKRRQEPIPAGLKILARRYCQVTPIEQERHTEAMTDFYTALDAFMDGRAEDDHMDVLVYAVNIGYLLTEIDASLGLEHRNTIIKPAMEALHRVRDRKDRTGKYRLDGEGLQALRTMSELHDVQLETAGQGEIEAALAEMHRRVAAGEGFKFTEEVYVPADQVQP